MSAYMEFGIDLGTTNSCIARCEGETVRIFQNDDLMNVTPSAVRILKSGRIIVGKKAYSQVVDDPENVAIEFKRAMGNKEIKQFPATGRELSPEDLSAEILKAMRSDVQRSIGYDVTAAVVTVPAAFGTLQCDATARAGSLAGIPDGTLLQEPIAAAIAYGIAPGSKDQYWLVYDLGGGTLDIAVVSTRDGRLTVLEHKGDNLLGGKDIDRQLVETHLLPVLNEQFALPDAESSPQQFQILVRRLTLKAEEAKIELSSRNQTVISMFDFGEDLEGKPIEMEIPLGRADLERIVDPLIERTLKLADEALAGARMQGKDLTKILLVGGPTQMPYLRAALTNHLSAPVDHSLDPMTVVAKGAALFAATVEAPRPAPGPTPPGAVTIKLAYDPVSAATETIVAGKVLSDAGAKGLEVRIASQAGYWDSGWLPVGNGYFEVGAVLQPGKICPFHVYARDGSGTTLEVVPSDFTIRHGLELSAPPLPHTISVEVQRPNGRTELDPIFPRKTPLPAEKRVSYRAARTLRPAEAGGSLAVKIWEGEEFQEPEANEWVGSMKITSAMIKRPIPESSEMELFIKIDTSRLITVDIFVPYLNEHFSDSVYVPGQEQPSDKDATAKLTGEIVGFTERLSALEQHLKDHPNAETEDALLKLHRDVVDLDIELAHVTQRPTASDPDQIRRLVAKARDLRTQISALEQRAGVDRFIDYSIKHAQDTVERVRGIVEQCGNKLDQYEFERRRKELEAAAERLDDRSVRKCIAELGEFSFRILSKHDWFWRDIFESIDKREGAFTNPQAAQELVQKGERAIREGNGDELRHAVRELWKLMPAGAAQEARDRAMPSGVSS